MFFDILCGATIKMAFLWAAVSASSLSNLIPPVKMPAVGDIIPRSCIHIDADLKEILEAIRRCLDPSSPNSTQKAVEQLQMIFTTSQNPNYVLPCLSGRTAFDLYLRAREFQPGSEIIMSAINIPDMVAIVQNHGLRVIPLDIDIDTLIPKYELIPQLVTHRTVAIVLAHLYGTTFDINPMITMAHQYNLLVIEDCAEAFGGFDYLGHPESDLSLFSFGLIKSRTAFGGCVAKVKDSSLFQKIVNIYDSDPCQTNAQYLKKLIKYFGIYFLLNASWFMRPGMWFCKAIKWDYQESVVNWVRGYPDSLLKRIRLRPSEALLKTMVCRLSQASEQDFVMARIKGRYVTEQISDHVRVAGASASQNNFWLFPVVVDDAFWFSRLLNEMGIDSYKGVTQLDVILPSNTDVRTDDIGNDFIEENVPLENCVDYSKTVSQLKSTEIKEKIIQSTVHGFNRQETHQTNYDVCYPKDAKYFIDHVVYLPVHKDVPFADLKTICEAVKMASPKIQDQQYNYIHDLKSKL